MFFIWILEVKLVGYSPSAPLILYVFRYLLFFLIDYYGGDSGCYSAAVGLDIAVELWVENCNLLYLGEESRDVLFVRSVFGTGDIGDNAIWSILDFLGVSFHILFAVSFLETYTLSIELCFLCLGGVICLLDKFLRWLGLSLSVGSLITLFVTGAGAWNLNDAFLLLLRLSLCKLFSLNFSGDMFSLLSPRY